MRYDYEECFEKYRAFHNICIYEVVLIPYDLQSQNLIGQISQFSIFLWFGTKFNLRTLLIQ